MTDIVVHAGAHRTGSTLVQETLAASRPRLAPIVRLYLPRDVLDTPFFQHCLHHRLTREDLDPIEGERLFRDSFLSDNDGKVLVSHEGLLGELMHRTFYGSPAYLRFFFGTLDRLALAGDRVAFILYMRPIDQLLRSMHVRHVHEKGGVETMEEFRDGIDVSCYRWEPILASARARLPHGRLVFRTFETISAPEVLGRFVEDAGLPELRVPDQAWTRRSPPPEELEAIRLNNRRAPPTARPAGN